MRVGSSWSWLNWVCCDLVMAWFGGIGLGWSDGDEFGRRRQLGQREGTDEEEIDLATGRVFKILPPSLAPWPAHA